MFFSVENRKRSIWMTSTATCAALASVLLAAGVLPARSEAAEKGPASGHELLMEAHSQLAIALHYAELAVAPHQPRLGWHRAHVQRATNVVVGE